MIQCPDALAHLSLFNEKTDRHPYRAAFSYYGGLNRPGKTSCFDIQRFAIEVEPFSRFRLQVSMGVASDGYWL